MSHLPDFSISGYRLIKIIGQNHHGGRIAYLAQELQQGQKVVIKQFQFAKSSLSWSVQDILEREIKILQQLEDQRYLAFLNQFRQEVAKNLFDPGKTSCIADIHLLKQDKNYFAVANRFGFKTSYGFFMRPPWHNPIMVVRKDSGLGTLTHQMMYHYLACSYPEGLLLWARQGAATFVEKFLAVENNKHLNFSWGYRSNWRDPHVRRILDQVNLGNALREGKQQSVIRSFLLFLHHQKLLFPLLDRLHGERGNGIDRIEQLFNQSIRSSRKPLETMALN